MGSRGDWKKLLPTALPGAAWLVAFMLLPSLFVFYASFLQRGANGWISGPLTLSNYLRFLGLDGESFDPLYLKILWRSLLLGGVTTAVVVLLGYPFAFFIALSKRKNLLLLLVVLPFWTNFLIRVYAWIVIFQRRGVLNAFLASVGFNPLHLYPSWTAVYVATVYTYLPFLILPLYASVEKIDWTLLEAAYDLGAGRLRGFFHAILPQTIAGLVSGVMLVFIPAVGTFVISDLLGAGKTVLIGNVIQQQFGSSRDWAFGSAAAFVLMAVVLLGLWIYARWAGEKGLEDLL